MSDLDESTGEGAERIERILDTPSARRLRNRVAEALDPRPGDRVLSIGCGPGYEPASLAERGAGRVLGVDVSRETLDLAAERCGDLPAVSLACGDASSLPVLDGRFDAAVAKQVYRFVPDVEAALRELARVLTPGGRAVVVARDVDSGVMNTADHDRLRRLQAAFRNADALAHPHLGTRLPTYAGEVGLTVEDVEPHASVRREITSRVEQGIDVHREVAEADGSIDRSEVDAWERELRELDEAGEFFRGDVQFVYLLRKPA